MVTTAVVRAKNKSILFEGLLEDAEIFLANNFPRVHDVNAEPDFTVETDPKGAKVTLPKGHPVAETDSDDVDLDTASLAELKDYANANDVDIDGLRTKAEIREAIDAAGGEGE